MSLGLKKGDEAVFYIDGPNEQTENEIKSDLEQEEEKKRKKKLKRMIFFIYLPIVLSVLAMIFQPSKPSTPEEAGFSNAFANGFATFVTYYMMVGAFYFYYFIYVILKKIWRHL